MHFIGRFTMNIHKKFSLLLMLVIIQ